MPTQRNAVPIRYVASSSPRIVGTPRIFALRKMHHSASAGLMARIPGAIAAHPVQRIGAGTTVQAATTYSLSAYVYRRCERSRHVSHTWLKCSCIGGNQFRFRPVVARRVKQMGREIVLLV